MCSAQNRRRGQSYISRTEPSTRCRDCSQRLRTTAGAVPPAQRESESESESESEPEPESESERVRVRLRVREGGGGGGGGGVGGR